MKVPTIVAVLAIASALAACGEKQSPVKTSGSDAYTVSASAPPAQADRTTPPDAVPQTHAMNPQPAPPPDAASAAPTARDTSAQQPLKDLSKAEEMLSLPKSGQVNNHSTTALDEANKATQSSATAPAADQPAK